MTRRTSRQGGFVEFVLEQMASAGQVRARRMFGGYGIYLAEHFVAIVLNSLGGASDRLLALLARHYELSAESGTMTSRIEATAVGLNENPERIMEAPIRMKFFFAEDREVNYAEVHQRGHPE